MTDTLRVKRRLSGSPGAPSSLANAELAYNEVDHILYYGEGTGGAGGTASTVAPIAGQGLASSALPLAAGTASAGTASTWARSDHVHPSTGASVTIGDAAPGSPSPGNMWWDSAGGLLYLYYQDPNSSQWVNINNIASAGASADVLRSYLAGLTLSTSGASTSFSVAPGAAADSTNAQMMTLASSITKTTGAFVAGSGNGSLDTGTIANSTWYHVYLITRTDTHVVDVLISLSATLPSLPASYTLFRRIGSLLTTASGTFTPFTQLGDDFLWTTPFTDVSNIPTVVAPTLKTLTVPTGVQVTASIQGMLTGATAGSYGILFSSPDTGGLAAGAGLGRHSVYASQSTGGAGVGRDFVKTNTAGQIYVSASSTGVSYYINTFGWNDSRGKNS